MSTESTPLDLKKLLFGPDIRGLYRNVFLASLPINLFVLAIPLFTMNVYDRVLPDFDEPTLIVLTIGVMMALFFDFILKVLRGLSIHRLSSILGVRQERDVMEHILSTPISAGVSTGQKLTLFRELSNIRQFWTTKIIPVLFDAPYFLIFLLIIYSISPTLSFVPLVAGGVLIACGVAGMLATSFFETYRQEQGRKKLGLVLETLQGASAFQGLNAVKDRVSDLEKTFIADVEAQQPEQVIQNALSGLSGFLTYAVSVFVVYFGAYEVSDQHLTLGGLVAISILSSRALSPIAGLSPVFSGYRHYQASVHLTRSVLGAVIQSDAGVFSRKNDLQGAVQLNNVSFGYSGTSRAAVTEINLSIPAGGRWGIIGRSGAGKTTLVKILSGLLSPNQGKVLWDQYQLEAISQEQRAEVLAYSGQEDYFFAGTLADNVFLGVNAPFQKDETHVKQIAFLSGLDLVMQQSGYGWDTPVAENGVNLSTGARQSLSLARAMMKDPKILILDEPLNGLDYSLEQRLLHHFPSWLQGRTLIMITHRTSLLPLVDQLILMEEGKIKSCGARDEIVKALK